MEERRNLILKKYDSTYGLHKNLKSSTELLIKNILKAEKIYPHQITSRLKERDSLDKKMERENYKYNSLEEITDIVALRIVTYFEDEIDIIAKLIEKEFEIDRVNSTDKRILATDKFGYRSLHYVAKHETKRIKLLEYSSFKNLKFEIQIRSILQHSWAEIEHDIGYKGESEIPNSAKRTFFRVAALLEQADIEFVKLKKEIKEYEKIVDNKIQSTPKSVEIDKASIKSFISNNQTVKKSENRIIKARENLKLTPQEKRNFNTNKRIKKILDKGINTISDLEKFYNENIENLIQKKIVRFRNDLSISGFIEGATIHWLIDEIEN